MAALDQGVLRESQNILDLSTTNQSFLSESCFPGEFSLPASQKEQQPPLTQRRVSRAGVQSTKGGVTTPSKPFASRLQGSS